MQLLAKLREFATEHVVKLTQHCAYLMVTGMKLQNVNTAVQSSAKTVLVEL